MRTIAGVLYLIIGFVVATNRGYFVDLSTIVNILSAAVSVFLWPLLLLGVNLHLVF